MRRRLGGGARALGGLLVPAIMLGFVCAYWWQAAGLSPEARLFPAALTVVLVVLLAVQVWGVWRTHRRAAQEVARTAPTAQTVSQTALQSLQRLALVVLAVTLTALWRTLGGTLVIFAFCLGALLVMGERRLWLLAGLPVVFAVCLTYLFKVVLLVRFPDGLMPIF